MIIDSIKEVFGNHYLSTILEHLNNQGFKSNNGKPLSKQIVYYIIHGDTNAPKIKEAIIKYVIATKKKNEKLLSKLN